MRATFLDIVIALNEACSGRVNDAPLESGATRRRDRPQSCIPRGESEPLSPLPMKETRLPFSMFRESRFPFFTNGRNEHAKTHDRFLTYVREKRSTKNDRACRLVSKQ